MRQREQERRKELEKDEIPACVQNGATCRFLIMVPLRRENLGWDGITRQWTPIRDRSRLFWPKIVCVCDHNAGFLSSRVSFLQACTGDFDGYNREIFATCGFSHDFRMRTAQICKHLTATKETDPVILWTCSLLHTLRINIVKKGHPKTTRAHDKWRDGNCDPEIWRCKESQKLTRSVRIEQAFCCSGALNTSRQMEGICSFIWVRNPWCICVDNSKKWENSGVFGQRWFQPCAVANSNHTGKQILQTDEVMTQDGTVTHLTEGQSVFYCTLWLII